MVNILTKLLLLLSPIVYGLSINLDKLDLRFFEIGCIVLFVGSLFDKPKREVKDIRLPIALLVGLCIVNAFWHNYQPLDLHAIQYLFYGILAFYIMVRYLDKPEECFKYIYWAIGTNIVIAYLQRIGYTPIISFSHYGAYIGCEGGLLGNSSKLAIYIAMILPFMSWFAIPLGALTLISGEYIVLIPLGLMLYFRSKYKILTTSLMTIGVVILHKQILNSLIFRWNNSWSQMLDMIFKKPLLGYGFGTYHIWTGRESFNNYLLLIFGFGVLGAVWMGYLVKWFIKRFDKSNEALAVAALLIMGMVEYVMEIPRLWLTICFVLAIFVIKQKGRGYGKNNLHFSRPQ